MSEPPYAERYRLVAALAPGRALARHRAVGPDGRQVTITVVRPPDPDAFLQGVDRVAAVRHADLVPVVDAGRDGADCYVVSEDVEGRDSQALVARGPLDAADAALVAAEAAGALAALHAGGALHGAVEPSALVRTAAGPVKLAGAGVAAGLRPPDLRAGAPADAARYLSPEEARGAAPGPAADVYRLGLVLYLMLTGAPAVDGEDAAAVAREHTDGVLIPPQMRNPNVPPALAQIVASALHKDPQQRPSAAALRARLERLLAGATFVEAPPPAPRSKAPLWIALAIVVIVAALVAAWAAGVFDAEEEPALVAVPDVVGMTSDGARNALEGAGLTVGTITEAESEDGPAGTVVEQTPEAGEEVDEGSVVDLRVSTGPTAPTVVEVPDVTGASQDAASQTLLAAGFVVVVTESASDEVPVGFVVVQRPVAGATAAPGSAVDIVVSTGPPSSPSPEPEATASP
ncbi:MAG: PASTA domain-containing protein [Thermoleophilia bacterium]|nr:PASTA domain-containing protein [Thermoleophilia bacterium]